MSLWYYSKLVNHHGYGYIYKIPPILGIKLKPEAFGCF